MSKDNDKKSQPNIKVSTEAYVPRTTGAYVPNIKEPNETKNEKVESKSKNKPQKPSDKKS